MYTKLLVIQKVNVCELLNVFYAKSDSIRWSFETQRTPTEADPDYFPFYLRDFSKIVKDVAGAETQVDRNDEGISFSDDYGVEAGTVIGILFPKNFVPFNLAFKDQPYIPSSYTGNASMLPPGQIQILSHHPEKYCAIVFHVHQNTFFGFSCDSRPVSDEDFANKVAELKNETLPKPVIKVVEEVWLNCQQVCELLNISKRTLMNRRRDGSIPFSGTARNFRYRKSDIDRLLPSNKSIVFS